MRYLLRLAFCTLTLLLAGTATLRSQSSLETPAAGEEAPAGALLRTYVNLVQVPVLVLQGNRQPMPSLEMSRFRVSIDSGPLFAPRHVRREGNDPLHILVLVDESSASTTTLDGVPDAVALLNDAVLTPRDRISLAASHGCVLATSASLVSWADKKSVITRVMERARSTRLDAAQQKRCGKDSHLWDNMVSSMLKLKDDPGRKVLLVFSNGADRQSRYTPMQLRELATRFSVTIFAVRRDAPEPQSYSNPAASGLLERSYYRAEGDPLITVAESSGGMVFEGHSVPTGDELLKIVSTIRDRYILDFSRPSSLSGGLHSIAVSIGDKHAFVRAGGTSVPMADASETNDPDRVPEDHSSEPPVGTRRILKP